MNERLRALGLRVADSQANFCWLHLGPEREEQQVMRGLRERGVLVRAGTPLGCEGALRVTFGTAARRTHASWRRLPSCSKGATTLTDGHDRAGPHMSRAEIADLGVRACRLVDLRLRLAIYLGASAGTRS